MKEFVFNDIEGLLNFQSLNILKLLKEQDLTLTVSPLKVYDFSHRINTRIEALIGDSLLTRAHIDEGFHPYYMKAKREWRELGYGDLSSIYYASSDPDRTLVTSSTIIEDRLKTGKITVISIMDFLPQYIKDQGIITFYSKMNIA